MEKMIINVKENRSTPEKNNHRSHVVRSVFLISFLINRKQDKIKVIAQSKSIVHANTGETGILIAGEPRETE